MAAPINFGHISDNIKRNGTDPEWWYERVFIPYILGPVVRYSSDAPGYDDAISVMEEDWDNLFILDACRADYFEEATDTNQFNNYRRVISQGSHSSEWTRRNFRNKEFGDTVYVTGNPHTKLLADDSFHDIIELRNSDNASNPLPSPSMIADAAQEAHKKYADKRLIVHFMQPHTPVHVHPVPDFKKLSSEEWWNMYNDSLENVLAEVFELNEEIDGKTVISADHGETQNHRLFSLFKIQSHPPRIRIPELVEVPWAVLSGERRTIEDNGVNNVEPDENVEQRLQDLGYKPHV